MKKEMRDVSNQIDRNKAGDELEINIDLGIVLNSIVLLIEKLLRFWASFVKIIKVLGKKY